MNATLLIIDPQNDFCDIPCAALPVPGADADMKRLAEFMSAARPKLRELIVTLDSHPSVAIERTSFWTTASAESVAPFTQITAEDVLTDKYIPRGAVPQEGREEGASLKMQVVSYLRALEEGGRYRLMVWPVHCVLGTWGHNMHEAIATQVAAWEEDWQQAAFKVLKGLNPMTEQYSAVRAEVPDVKDPLTQTNHKLIGRARPPQEGVLFVGGEAASHCVASSMEHLFQGWTREELSRVVVLRDCMSPVAGFEAQAEEFFDKVSAVGGRVMTSHEALSLLA